MTKKLIEERIEGGEVYQGYFGGSLELFPQEGSITAKVCKRTYEIQIPLTVQFTEEEEIEPAKDKKGNDKKLDTEMKITDVKASFPFNRSHMEGNITPFIYVRHDETILDSVMETIGNAFAELEFYKAKLGEFK